MAITAARRDDRRIGNGDAIEHEPDKGVINPLAAICAGQMMLDFLGETKAAKAIEDAVIKITREKMKSLAAGKMGYSTSQVGDLVAAAVAG